MGIRSAAVLRPSSSLQVLGPAMVVFAGAVSYHACMLAPALRVKLRWADVLVSSTQVFLLLNFSLPRSSWFATGVVNSAGRVVLVPEKMRTCVRQQVLRSSYHKNLTQVFCA